MKVYNKNKQQIEKAKKVECPRCKGFGAIAHSIYHGSCHLCNGHGKLWKSESGWTRALNYRLKNSQLW